MKMHSIVLGSATIFLGMGMSCGAQAALPKVFFQNAAGFCQPALPTFDGNIRKRPTGVANEGATNAFVSCSAPTSAESSTGITSLNLALANRTTGDIIVTCSLVNSFLVGGAVIPKTVTIPANNIQFVTWTTSDVGNPASMMWANFSCNLPPGTDVSYIFYNFT